MTSPNRVHRFVVTLRWESNGLIAEQSEWRGSIVNVLTEETAFFRGKNGLTDAWQRITAKIPSAPDPEDSKEI